MFSRDALLIALLIFVFAVLHFVFEIWKQDASDEKAKRRQWEWIAVNERWKKEQNEHQMHYTVDLNEKTEAAVKEFIRDEVRRQAGEN